MRPVQSTDICFRTADNRTMIAARVYLYTPKQEELARRIRNLIGGFPLPGPTVRDYTSPDNGQKDIICGGVLMVRMYRDDLIGKIAHIFPNAVIENAMSRRLIPAKLEKLLTAKK